MKLAAPAPPGMEAKILLVDDRDENLLALESVLEPLGHALHRARSGEEALREVLAHDFAVILMDVQMPGMDGFETTAMVKSRERSREIPIIFLTAINKDDEYVFRGYDVGAVDYMFKPFHPEILRGKVAVFVDLFLKGQRLLRQQQLLEEAQRVARMGSWEWDPDTGGASFTRQALELYGLDADIRSGDLDLLLPRVHEEDRKRFAEGLRRVASGEGAVAFDHRTEGKGGEERTLHTRAQTMGTGGPGERSVLVTVHDVTEAREAEEARRVLLVERAARERAEAGRAELEEQKAKLQTASAELSRRNEELDRFSYVASHDLKAPLRGIANLATWVEDDLGERLSDDARHYLELMRGRVHRMEGMVQGLLEYSRVGRQGIAPEVVDVGLLVEDVLDLLAPPPEIEVVVPPSLPSLTTRRLHLRQVFQNLVGNALKHTRTRVEIGACDENSDIHFWVRDDGPGIAPAYHDKIWQIFQRLEARDDVEGTGLGLAMVKKILEEQGGKAWVESEEGDGATFHFLWPRGNGGG